MRLAKNIFQIRNNVAIMEKVPILVGETVATATKSQIYMLLYLYVKNCNSNLIKMSLCRFSLDFYNPIFSLNLWDWWEIEFLIMAVLIGEFLQDFDGNCIFGSVFFFNFTSMLVIIHSVRVLGNQKWIIVFFWWRAIIFIW